MGKTLNQEYVAANIKEIHNKLNVEWNVLFEHFSNWGEINWGEINSDSQYVKDVSNYVVSEIFDEYKNNSCIFCDSIIKLGINAIEYKPKGFLINTVNYTTNDYWRKFILCYLGSRYMPKASAHLTEELVTSLERIRTVSSTPLSYDDVVILLEQKADPTTLDVYLRDQMNCTLNTQDISESAFHHFGTLLPHLGSEMDKNIASGLITHFIKPIANQPNCMNIIVANEKFYLDILSKDISTAIPVIKEMIKLIEYQAIKEKLEKLIRLDGDSDN
jgi:hypothetical protein